MRKLIAVDVLLLFLTCVKPEIEIKHKYEARYITYDTIITKRYYTYYDDFFEQLSNDLDTTYIFYIKALEDNVVIFQKANFRFKPLEK